MPETYFTVWTNVFRRDTSPPRIPPGERRSSGLGHHGHPAGTRVRRDGVATAGSDAKCAACLKRAAAAINYKARDFVERSVPSQPASASTSSSTRRGDYLERNLAAAGARGAARQIGLQGGANAHINLRTVISAADRQRLDAARTPGRGEGGDRGHAELEQHVWPLFASAIVAPSSAHLSARPGADAHRCAGGGRGGRTDRADGGRAVERALHDERANVAAAVRCAQAGGDYEPTLAENQRGRKRSMGSGTRFRRIAGLGASDMSQTYAIRDRGEAIEYLNDQQLRRRAARYHPRGGRDLRSGRGSTDDGSSIDAAKLVSSMTLFAEVARGLPAQVRSEDTTPGRSAEEIRRRRMAQGYPRCAHTRARLAL